MKKFRQCIAVLCSVALLLCVIPTAAFATDNTTDDTAVVIGTVDTSAVEETIDIENLSASDIVGEVTSLRDASTKHFQLADGSMLAVSYPVSVHEQIDGEWIDIDNTLTEAVSIDGDTVLQSGAQTMRVSFAADDQNGRLVTVENVHTDAQVSMSLYSTNETALTVAEQVPSQELFALPELTAACTFENVYDDIDIDYVLTGTTLKENIIVKTVDAMQALTFALHCQNMTAVLQEDNSVLLQDADGNTAYTIPAPFMYDADGAYCDDITVGLTQNSTGYLYTMIPSAVWTSDPARVYPITIDPVVQSGLDAEAIHGAYVKESEPTTPKGTEQFMWIGENGSEEGHTCYGLLKFDLPEIKASSYVISAAMYLYPSMLGREVTEGSGWDSWNSNYLDESMILEAHKITSAWDEDTVTWKSVPTFSPTVMDAVPLTVSHSIHADPPIWTVINVSDVAKAWYNGSANNGVLFKLNNTGSHAFAAEYYTDLGAMSADHPIMQAQPAIAIQYRSKAGVEGVYSYTSASAGTAGVGSVQLSSGNLVFSHGDLALGGGSMPVAISHVYNTCNNTVNKGYGYGWRINYAQTVVHKTIGTQTYYAYTDEDGTVHYFDITESKDEYTDESGLELTLTVGDTVDIRTKDDVVYSFSKTSGRLGRVRNPYGKSATVTYNDYGRIKTITDGLSRTYTFTYENNMLAQINAPDGRTMTFNYTDGNLTSIIGHNSAGNFENNTYVYGANRELKQAYNTLGDDLLITYKGAGEGARVATLTTRAKVDGTYYKKGYTAIEYGMHDTTVTDEKGRTVTYQFNLNGNTRGIYNDIGQAQYYRYYAPNEQNPNGEEAYGPNKLEAASQTQWSAQNYLLNHSFESDDNWGDLLTLSDEDVFEGNKSAVVEHTADTDSTIISQTITLTKGVTYTASAYVHSGDNTQVMMFADYGASTDDYGSYTIDATGGWTRIQFTFTVPSNATTSSVRVGFKVTGQGPTYIDGVQLEKSTTANRYNLLQNGDFTANSQGTTQPTGWTAAASNNTTVGVDTSASGQTAFGLSLKSFTVYPPSVANSSASQVYATATLAQSVPVKNGKAGTTFSYGAWMKANSLPDPLDDEDDVVFGITLKLYNDGAEVQTQFTPANRFCPDWQFVGDVIVAKQTFDKAEIILEYQNNCNRAYFDGAYLYRDYFGQSFTYDDDGNVISTSAYADQNATFEYTPDGDLATSVMTDGTSFEYTYNDYHAVLTGTSAEGVTSGYTYDESATSDTSGQIKASQTELGTARNYTKISRSFDDNNLLLSETVTDVRGEAVKTYYNADGSLKKTVDAAGITTAYTYNHRGQQTAVTATDPDGNTLSTITYDYDSRARLSVIHNGDVNYYFTYDNYDRVVKVSVGTSATNAVTLSENTYAAATNGVASTLVEQSAYGNGDKKVYTYDDRGRVIGVRYEDETTNHYTYTYDSEGNLVSLKNNRSGQRITYYYDLNKRLSEIRTNTGYGLRYEYDAGNALVGVIETVNGVENSSRYVYNKDDVMIQVQSETGSTVQYDYSYDRRADYVTADDLRTNTATLGFPTNKENITVEAYDASLCPVPSQNAVSITRNGSVATISNGNAYWTRWLTGGERYVMSVWYQAKNAVAEGDLVAALSYSNGTTEVSQKIEIIDDGGWHYAEFVLTASAPVYSTKGSYVTPCLRWTTEKSTGILNLSGLSFSHESETVVMPADLGKTISTYNATDTAVDDDTAPMPSTQVRQWTRAANKSGWVYLTNKELATSTPQAGEIWEATFSAKTVSGSGGTMLFRFRQCDENGAVTSTDASTADSVTLTNDGAWHTYKLYVTVNANAYENYSEIVPRFGWASSNTAGTVYVNGLTVRKVGNQWNNQLPNMGLEAQTGTVTTLGELAQKPDPENPDAPTAADSPIAYQKTIKAEHLGTQYSYTLNAPLASFLQTEASDTWTLSFWAKCAGAVSLATRTDSNKAPTFTTLSADGQWRYYVVPLNLSGLTLNTMSVYYQLSAQSSLYLNGVNLVPGTVALANESHQNSTALKNITIKTGSATFNTAIEYDTDVNHYAYSRVKHYIVNGKAYSYEYDDAGNISKIQNPDGDAVTYEYDALNQLKAEHFSTCLPLSGEVDSAQAEDGGVVSYDTIEYTYDNRGNILSKTYSLGETTVDTVSYTYNDSVWKDRLTKYDGVEITYDTIGNPRLWHDGAEMSWQKGRQLASYTKNGVKTAFTYDDEGIRRSKTTNGVKTEYNVYDGTLRSLTSGSNTMRFVYGNGLSSVIFNNTEYWYVFNAQGDVIGLIDASGSYVVQYTYDAWGKPLSKSGDLADTLGTLNPFRYRGYIYDEETGLYYLQSRYYDPTAGRFLNADGYLATDVSTIGHNMYAYCGNNPVSRIDPTGEAWWHWALGATIVVGCAVATVVTCGGFAAAAGAVAAVGSGVAAATTAATIAAGAFIGSATVYGMAVLSAASTSSSVQEFNDQGNWGTVVSTGLGALSGGVDGYTMSKAQATQSKTQATQNVVDDEPFLPDSFYSKHAPKQSIPNSSYTNYTYNNHTGKYEKSTAYYDFAGRQTIRIDWTNHGYSNHGNPHVHYTTYNSQYRDGFSVRWD